MEVQPLEGGSAKSAVVQVESINVDISAQRLAQKRGGRPERRPRTLPQLNVASEAGLAAFLPFSLERNRSIRGRFNSAWTEFKRRRRFADTVSSAAVRVYFLFSEVQLGHVQVVAFAHQPNIVRATIATEPVWIVVVVLEPVALGTSSAIVIYVRALPTISGLHETLHRGRDAPHTR